MFDEQCSINTELKTDKIKELKSKLSSQQFFYIIIMDTTKNATLVSTNVASSSYFLRQDKFATKREAI